MRLTSMRWAGLILAAAAYGQDARALVEQSLRRDVTNQELARQYAFTETVAEQEWKDGRRTARKTETFEVVDLYGEPYRPAPAAGR